MPIVPTSVEDVKLTDVLSTYLLVDNVLVSLPNYRPTLLILQV